jgi:CHAT domain-containing protein
MAGVGLGGVLGLAVTAWTATVIGTQAPPPAPPTSPFEACAASAATPRTQAHTLCLYRVAVRERRLPEVRDRLVRLGAGTADHPWPTMVLGYATQEDDETRALRLYETAARGFVAQRDPEGEVLARHNLRNLYFRRGGAAAAAEQVALALASAETSGQPLTIARASVLEASHVVQAGGDFGRAWRTLQRAQRLAFPDGPIGLRRSILLALANASFYLGRLDESIAALEGHRALMAEDGSTVDAATVAFNLLNARLTRAEQRPRPGARERLTSEATGVLAEVQRLARPALVAQTHRVLADLTRTTDATSAAAHLQQCLALEKSLEQPELRASCLWTQSLLEARRDPAQAERASRAAIDALKATPNSPLLVYAWQARLRFTWHTMQEDAAIPAALQALDAIERLRARQQDEGTRAGVFSQWARDYYWLVGQLLQADTPRLAQAFEVGERLRARTLLEHLARSGVAAPAQGGPTPQSDARDRVRQRIVDAQRRLLGATARSESGPYPGGNEQRALLDQLQLLELEERDLDTSAGAASSHPVAFATLDDVQRGLDDSEALLWYSMAPWEDVYGDFGGGAWLVTVTRRDVRVHRLPSGVDLQSQVTAFVGLLRDRDRPADRWAPAAERLGRTLVEPALGDLPRAVQRLVIVPDGDLHALPFEALTTGAGSRPFGEQFDIALVPSATLWLRLRRQRTPATMRTALVLADPDLAGGVALDGSRLGALPWARREAHAIARTLQLDDSQVREGRGASERFLKSASLHDVAVSHLAAHARADEAFPDRSAGVLAPGDAGEDGWLQPREIAALSLAGRLVVLSACESAGGSVLSGEGPLSLARAFFAGGADTVVATRWPLRDDDAAFLMERFYKALHDGNGASTAWRLARREAIDHGLPVSAWASIVVLGEGHRPPLAAAPPQSFARHYLVAGLAVIVAAVAAVVVGGRRRGPANT